MRLLGFGLLDRGPRPERRAEALLLRHLTPEQQATYLKHGWFEVRGRDGSLWTVDRNGGSRNVMCMSRNGLRIFCSDLEKVPRADTLLVQKLSIEASGGRGLPCRQGEVLSDEELFHTTVDDVAPPDPVGLNQAALHHRKRDQLELAERRLREAIALEDAAVAADSPKRPHRRNNLAIVLMRAGNLAESVAVNAEAWRLKAGQHDLTSGRILFVRIALTFLRGDRNVRVYLGQLKTLLRRESLTCRGDIADVWDVPDVLGMLCEELRAADAELLLHAAEVLNDRNHFAVLKRLDAWKAARAVALESPWPDG
jgi:hypothetical protein